MKTYLRSSTCYAEREDGSECRAIIMVRNRRGISKSLLRNLAIADHLKVAHPDLYGRALGAAGDFVRDGYKQTA